MNEKPITDADSQEQNRQYESGAEFVLLDCRGDVFGA